MDFNSCTYLERTLDLGYIPPVAVGSGEFREGVYCLLVIKQNQSETMDILSDLLNCTEKAFSKEPKKKKTGESFLQKEMGWHC